MSFADKSWTAERSLKFHRCSRNIAGNSRESAELINSIIIGPYLETKLWGSTRGLASAGASIPLMSFTTEQEFPCFRRIHTFPIFTKITFSMYFSSPYFYHDTFMHHSLHVLDAPVLQW